MISRAEAMLTDVLEEVAKLRREKERLEDEVARLGKDNDDQCDVIFELQQMVSRAHECIEQVREAGR